VPIWTIPFGIFFGVVYGHGFGDFLPAYEVSLIFAFTINVFVWAAQWFVLPLVAPEGGRPGPGRVIRHLVVFGSATVLGTLTAALTLHFTIMPAMLGSVRSIATLAMFTLLFLALVTGIVTAMRFYRDSIERARSDHELVVARRIQRSFLISQFPVLPGLDVYATNVPSRQVSGDFYDVLIAADGVQLLAIADVAGKGVPAALLTSMLQAALRMQAHDPREVCEMLTRINALVYRSTEVEQFATFFLARFDDATRRLSYSNAGHNIPVVFNAGGGRRMLERGGTVIGILEQCRFEEESVQLTPGDRVVFYTDGISEAANASGEMFGEERLYDVIERMPPDLTARAVADGILEAVRTFLDGTEPGDDMTVMVLRVVDRAGTPAS
jgi:hypothetical protein